MTFGIAVRIHARNQSSFDLTSLRKCIQAAQSCTPDALLLAVDSQHPQLELIQSLWPVLIIPVWGSFVPALNTCVSQAMTLKLDHLLFCSVEILLNPDDVKSLLIECEPDTLVVGKALPGHQFSVGLVPLTGLTSPWNTLAVWNVALLSLTGFLLVSEGQDGNGGVEEVPVIALLQSLQKCQAKLLQLSSKSDWNVDWDDPSRQEWHSRKMASKDTRASLALSKLGLTSGGNIGRHGARYPTSSTIGKFDSLVSYLSKNQDSIRLDALRNLSNPYDMKDAGELAPAGVIEMTKLGRLANTRYASLMSGSIVVQTSDSNRVVDSASIFTNELVGQVLPFVTIPGDIDADMRPHVCCSAFSSQPVNHEAGNWLNSKFGPMARRKSTKAGLVLTTAQTYSLLEMCAYDIALFNSSLDQGVCSIFEPRDFDAFGVYGDLESYYTYGHGKPFNSNLTCSLITSIAHQASSLESRVILKFGHAETMMPLMTGLGLFQDMDPITATSSHATLNNREWLSSRFAPFSGNLWVEVYIDQVKYLRLIVDDVVVSIPGCTPHPLYSQLCSLSSFLKVFSSQIECDFDAICGNSVPTQGTWRDYINHGMRDLLSFQ